jgi:hypothetical protein
VGLHGRWLADGGGNVSRRGHRLVVGQTYRLVTGIPDYFFPTGFGGRIHQRVQGVPERRGTVVLKFNQPALLGIVFGVVIGWIYIALQWWELRLKNAVVQPRGVVALVPGAAGRLVFLVAAWWLAFKFTAADKYWLTGALAVTYTAPLLVQLKELIFPKK